VRPRGRPTSHPLTSDPAKFEPLDPKAVKGMKAIIQTNGPLPDPNAANLREVMGALEVFAGGEPQARFAKLAAVHSKGKL
jgi:hypothetical protein